MDPKGQNRAPDLDRFCSGGARLGSLGEIFLKQNSAGRGNPVQFSIKQATRNNHLWDSQ